MAYDAEKSKGLIIALKGMPKSKDKDEPEGDEDEASAEDEDEDEGLESAVADFFKAAKSGDAKAGAKALKAAIEMC
jgi:hypothetical protein